MVIGVKDKAMYIDYKKTTWERIYIGGESEITKDELIALIKKHEPTNYGLWEDLPYEPTVENLDDTDEFMSAEENDGCSTIELYSEDHVQLWNNSTNNKE